MALRVEWRSRDQTDDTLLIVDAERNTVQRALVADAALLAAFLTDMAGLDGPQGEGLAIGRDNLNPEAWGDLIIARAETQEVLDVDPEPYWEGIYRWFRSRGVDPHSK